MREWWRFVWPRRVSKTRKTQSVLQLIVIAVSTITALLDLFGFWNVSANVFRALILFATASVLLTLQVDLVERATDSLDRAEAREERKALNDAVRAAIDTAGVRAVPAAQIGPGLRGLLTTSRQWTFRGGSGRYLRSDTLPTLGQVVSGAVPVHLEILDPRDLDLCKSYAEYRRVQRTHRESRENEGDVATILGDLLASLYSATWYSANTRVEAKVVLLRSFSPLRFDMGSGGVFVTVADRLQPGLFASSDTWYYESVMDEMQQTHHGHPTLRLAESTAKGVGKTSVDGEAVRATLDATIVLEGGRDHRLLEGVAHERLDFDAIAARVFPVDSPYD